MLHSLFKVDNVIIHSVLHGIEFSLLRCLREARVLDKCLRLCWGLLVKLSVLLLLWWLGKKALVACWSLGWGKKGWGLGTTSENLGVVLVLLSEGIDILLFIISLKKVVCWLLLEKAACRRLEESFICLVLSKNTRILRAKSIFTCGKGIVGSKCLRILHWLIEVLGLLAELLLLRELWPALLHVLVVPVLVFSSILLAVWASLQ
jgi:hypothetical protein